MYICLNNTVSVVILLGLVVMVCGTWYWKLRRNGGKDVKLKKGVLYIEACQIYQK